MLHMVHSGGVRGTMVRSYRGVRLSRLSCEHVLNKPRHRQARPVSVDRNNGRHPSAATPNAIAVGHRGIEVGLKGASCQS